MSSGAHDNYYEDVFVFKDLVYAMECRLGVVHVYRNRNNSLIGLHDVRYPCGCAGGFPNHTIIVTNVYIVQCCAIHQLISVGDRTGELLQKIPITDKALQYPALRQMDLDGNFLIAERLIGVRKRLVVANTNQSSSHWDVVNLPIALRCCNAVWFRRRLYLVYLTGQLLTFTYADLSSLTHLQLLSSQFC